MDISGKTAIVTGGGSGVGKAIAAALVHEGVNVVIASRRLEMLTYVADKLNRLGKGQVVAVKCDLLIKSDIENVVTVTKKQFSSIDFLVNNSGLGVQTKIVNCSEEDWDRVLDTNLKGTFLMTQAVLPTMITQRSGFILNIASQAAKHGYPEAGPYCASKFGVVGLGEALQEEVREYGIRVHSLCPGLIQVPMPGDGVEVRKGVLQVEDVAAIAVFLLKQPPRVKLEDIGMFHL
jgi:NADP-dependent 3-hydroxy acid dehydrogenase YdfG